MATIVVGSYMVRYPLGGNLSWALQYLTGLKDLGHDVYMVEKYVHEESCYNPGLKQMTDDCTYGVKTVSELMWRFGLEKNWCFVERGEHYHGLSKDRIEDIIRNADLFIENGSHGVWAEELETSKAKRVYIDVDPAFTQIKFFHKKRRGEDLPDFDFFFTNGWNIGKPNNVIPTCGIEWQYIFNPVNPRLFHVEEASSAGSYSTIMNWKSYTEEAKLNGIVYGHKDQEFEKFMMLPSKVEASMDVAIANAPQHKHRALTENGWTIHNAQEVTSSYDTFMQYLASCRGEFSVVKHMYAATSSGWFSDKSAAFLASGRPVVLQETGFSEYLPVGEGLFAVNTLEEAKDAIEQIESDYARHSAKAREIAHEYLDAKKVLRDVLVKTGIG